jgi:hypothetical protein
MKRILFAMTLAIAALPAFAADVGVSVSVGQPGFYGRIDVGNAPPPRVIYVEPVVIQRVEVVQAPVYLHVPPGHEKNWGKHCRKYNACGRPVYFVRDDWYEGEYVPYHQKHAGHGKSNGGKKGHDKGHGKGNKKD